MLKRKFLDYLHNSPVDYEDRQIFRTSVEDLLRKFIFDDYLAEMTVKLKWNVIVKIDHKKPYTLPSNFTNTDKVYSISVKDNINEEGILEVLVHSDSKDNIAYWIKNLVKGDYSILFMNDDFEVEYRPRRGN